MTNDELNKQKNEIRRKHETDIKKHNQDRRNNTTKKEQNGREEERS